ncbi:MAG: hypothetical protein WC710_07330 [Gallionella sp.]|jgi:predicted DNA-binding transcriptional regulator AlpA
MEQNQQISRTLAVLLQSLPGVIMADFDQVAQAINTSKSACYIRANRRVDFPKVTKIGSRSLVKLTDLADWIDAQASTRRGATATTIGANVQSEKKRGRPTKRQQIERRAVAVRKGGE